MEPTNAEKIRKLPWVIGRNATNTIFVQFTYFGSVFILFLSELNLNKTQIGLLLSFFPFFGVVAIFLAPSVARFGYKRTWVWFYGIRKIVTIFLMFVPWVLSRTGPQFTLIYVSLIVILFGLCRAISETALYPWSQEYIPNSIRGKFAAVNNMVMSIAGVIAVAIASYVVGRSDDLNRFTLLFGVGIVFGFVSVWASTQTPGGAPEEDAEATSISQSDYLKTLRDRNFLVFILGRGLVTLAIVPMFSFIPLFMEQQVGLSKGNIVLLQNGTLLGTLAATYLVGWASDRYGSKPVMLSGIWLTILLPIGWLLMPRLSSMSLPIALGIAFLQGASQIAWLIGSARMLFVSVVPTEEKTTYLGVYYAFMGIIGGISQLLGGFLLDLFSDLSGEFSIITIDSFTPLFVLGLGALLTSLMLYRYIQADSTFSVGQFAGMFIHGNPFVAFESMIRYYRAKDERATVAMTERLGQSHSPLTVEELVEALADPRFNVRFEALISIARTNPDPRLVEALIGILEGTELAMSSIAAWALGRIGDPQAVDALRGQLNSEYRSIQAQCARALGTLGDQTIAPILLERLKNEEDKGLQMAFASTLGSLQATEATPTIAALLYQTKNEKARMELALALARMVGDERNFVRLLRNVREDIGTPASQVLFALGRSLNHVETQNSEELAQIISQCTNTLARQDIDAGITQLNQVIDLLPEEYCSPNDRVVLKECSDRLKEYGQQHLEYLILALHTLEISFNK